MDNPLGYVDQSGQGPCPPAFASACNMGNHSYGVSYLWDWGRAWDEFSILDMILGPGQTTDVASSINGVPVGETVTFFSGDLSLLDLIGAGGSGNSSGLPQQPSKLAQTLDRAKTCAKAYYGFNTLPGAVTDVTRVGTLVAAAPLPKSWLSTLGIRTTTLAGGSSFTNILSVLGQGAGTAASGANTLRIAGRMAGPIAIASAVIDVAAIGVCTVIDQ
jgi:hypothetical protein